MAEEVQWFAGKPGFESVGLAFASDTEAYAGQLAKSRELTKRAVDSAVQNDNKENGAIWQAIAAQREAAFGNTAEARKLAAEALKLAPTSQGAESEAALAFAMAGDTNARAESLTRDLGKRFPLGYPNAIAVAACDSGPISDESEESNSCCDHFASGKAYRIGDDSILPQRSVSLSCVWARRSIFGSWARQRRCSRISENSRSQWDCLELLDGSVGASGRGSRQCPPGENLARSRCRCRTRPGARRLQRFSSHSGKTPTPTFQSKSKPKLSTPSCSNAGIPAVLWVPSCPIAPPNPFR